MKASESARAARCFALRAALSLAAAWTAGCGEDLGPCDMAAASELVYGRAGLVATKGQALMHDSCGNAAYCHSSNAKSGARYGVPAGLSFDMLPLPSGWPKVQDERDAIWSAVEGGEMPPSGIGGRVVSDSDWMFDVERSPGAQKLPPIATEEGKAILRNWLACDAPVVTETHVPDWAQPLLDGGDASDWSSLYSQIVRPSCASSGFCHNASGAGGLVMTDMCGARESLLQAGACGRPRVIAGDGESLLLEKIEQTEQSCGSRMPPTGALPSSAQAAIRAWIEDGARAEECGAP